MKTFFQRIRSKVLGPKRLATSAAVLIVAVAAAAFAAQASAAQPVRAKLKHGLLAVDGTKASENEPSAESRRMKLGIRKATTKASIAGLAPKTAA